MLHYFDEAVKRLLRLRLSRLYHDGLMEEQREIDCRSMESVIQQSLSYVKCCHPCRLVLKTVKHELMLAYRLYWQSVAILQRLLDVVCTEDGKWADHAYVLPAEHQNVCIRPQKHTEIAHES